jgi:hypothetical protein
VSGVRDPAPAFRNVPFAKMPVLTPGSARTKARRSAGVERQVTNAIEHVKNLPDVELNNQIDGSLIDRHHPERGHWPPGVLVDDDISAAKGARRKRPEYIRLMNYARGADIQVIVSSEQDRLWRDLQEAADGMVELKDLDIRLSFVKTGVILDLSDDFTQAVVGMMAVFAGWFTRNIAAKQRSATREAAQAGAYHGARPFGFQRMHFNDPGNPAAGTHEPDKIAPGDRVKCTGCGGRASNKARTLVHDETEAPAVREAYELVAAGVSPYAVCQYLDGQVIDGPDGARISRLAVPTVGGHRWEDVNIQSLHMVLTAKRNIGKREWSAKWDGGKRPPGTLIEANWPGIVDEPLFDTVQKQLEKRHTSRPGGNEPAHLLTGFAYCGTCGSRLRIHRIKDKRRYACSAWQGKGCVSFEASVAESEVTRYLYKWLSKNTMLTKTLERTGNADLQQLYDKRRDLERLRDEIDNDFSDGVYMKPDGTKDRERYRRLITRKDEQIAEKDREIESLLDSSAAGGGKRLPTGKAFRAEWRSADLDGKRAIVRQFIDKVVIYPAGAGNKPDPRLVHIYPGKWAAGVEDAQPDVSAPDPVSFTSKGKILAFLGAHPGEWFTRQDIAAGTEITADAVHKCLTALGAGGEVSREWRKRGGQRACYMFSAASGESWGPRTRNAPGGAIGARETIKSFLESMPTEWFSAAEIGEGSGGKYGAPHVTRIVNELVTASFAQRRRAPLPHKHVRWQYSINGR